MTSGGAKRLVVAAVVTTGVLSSVKAVSKGHAPSVRIGLGLLVAGVTLSLLAEGQPDLAGSFAALFLVSAIFNVGGDAFASLSKGLS